MSELYMDRREFLKAVLGTASLVMVQGVDPLLAEEVATRPVAEPVVLSVDSGRRLYDPDFDWAAFRCPSVREIERWDELTAEEREILLVDWSKEDAAEAEIEEWLNEEADAECVPSWMFAELTDSRTAMQLAQSLSTKEAERFGIGIVDGPQPGCDAVYVVCEGNVDKLNRWLRRNGWNLIVKQEAA